MDSKITIHYSYRDIVTDEVNVRMRSCSIRYGKHILNPDVVSQVGKSPSKQKSIVMGQLLSEQSAYAWLKIMKPHSCMVHN